MPAALRRRRARFGKERILAVKLRELPLREAANEDHRQRPLARFVRADHLHRVAAAIAHAQAA